MLTIHSPKFSTGKTQLTKQSPTFRHRRAPSATDNYTVESKSKASGDSPAKLSEGRPRQSRIDSLPASVASKRSKDKGTKEIISSIQNLKEQYRHLKEAYKELIQERLKNVNQMGKIKNENNQLLQQNERLLRQNQRFRMQFCFIQQQNQRIRRECIKMLEVQKFKALKLEESLVEKEQYINQTLLKIRTEGDETILHQRSLITPIGNQDVSLTISQDKSAIHQPSINNQSQFLSFSLTSILEESTDKEPSVSRRKHEHNRTGSDIPPKTYEDDKRTRQLPSFRKPLKKEMPRLQLTNIESKANLISSMGHRLHVDKKVPKVKTSKSFRQKQNRQTFNNKKKSKKLINLSAMGEY